MTVYSSFMSLLDDFEQDEGEWFELTLTQRLLGCVGTSVIGIFSGVLSLIAIGLLRIRKFSILFAIFNLMIISSTGFIVGFKNQLRFLMEKKRIYATFGMLFGFLITIVFALKLRKLSGAIIGVVVEGISFVYYALSYLPFGKQIFKKIFF